MDFSWIGEEGALTSVALTVRAQAVDPTDDGTLLWDQFFPRDNVDSIELAEITTFDFRPVADRREWNQRGRIIPLKTPSIKELEMNPIESTFGIAEYEMQKLATRVLGNQALMRQMIGASIPARTDGLVAADYRRIEMDCMEAWSLGQVTAMNPQKGTTQVFDYGFASGRYQTAGTAWNDAGISGYDAFLGWLEDGQTEVRGGIIGAAMRQATYDAIRADAPNSFIPDSSLNIQVTRSQLEQRIRDDLGRDFAFYIIENTLETFDDGGIDTTATKIWPAQQVAAVPTGVSVGRTAFAPVYRAMEMAAQVPEAGIDIRGVTVFHETSNAGRQLNVEAQVNAMPVPDEAKLWVIDAGV